MTHLCTRFCDTDSETFDLDVEPDFDDGALCAVHVNRHRIVGRSACVDAMGEPWVKAREAEWAARDGKWEDACNRADAAHHERGFYGRDAA